MSGGRNLREFLDRWSQRKRAHEAATAAPRPTPPRPARAASIAAVELEHLDFSSDYTRFLGTEVPQEVASRALRKLWSSSDIIARPDELDDYLEDFTEAAMALSPEAARSGYRIGRGLAADDEASERSAEGSNDDGDGRSAEGAQHSEDSRDAKVARYIETD